jgi:hypothetical protein
MAILFPTLFLLIFAAVHIVAYFNARSAALTAAQAAVSAERQLDAEPGEGRLRAEAFLEQVNDWLYRPAVSDPVYTADGVSYTVSGTAPSLIPGIAWEVRQTAHGTREQFTTSTVP